ncbi:MAG: glycosyltransferase family 4 protein [Bacteroidaceae bacterium]|nr:glycosyltransferase family 4 protein [Bacteroidaceae bacterium]
MKKILCLIDRLSFGGAERQLIGLAVLLKQKGYDVEMATYHDFDFSTEVLEANNILLHRISQKGNPLSKLLAVRSLINKRRYDVVIAYKSGVTMMACLLKKLGGQFWLIVSERNTTQVLTKREKLKFWLYRYADFVVPNSYAQAEFIKGHYPELAGKTVIITNFTDTDFFSPADTAANRVPIILTTARVAKQKNVLAYLEAAKVVKEKGLNVRFQWFGNVQIGEADYARKCNEAITAMDLADVFELHPATSNILPVYQQCDIFCLPSLYEGFPNVVCEAMGCGKPIVCSRVCDNESIVGEGENALLFDPKSAEDIAEKLEKMLLMPKDRMEQWGRRSRELAVARFSKDTFVHQYMSLIEKMNYQ